MPKMPSLSKVTERVMLLRLNLIKCVTKKKEGLTRFFPVSPFLNSNFISQDDDIDDLIK
jgi:hypothetical protein